MTDKTLPPLARRLKELRDARGLTQQQMAGQAGLSMSLVTQMEQGTKADPRLSTLLALARALGVAVADLIRGVEEAPPVEEPRPKGRPRKPPSPPAETPPDRGTAPTAKGARGGRQAKGRGGKGKEG